MNFAYLLLLIRCVLSLTINNNFDIEVEGTLRFGDELMEQLNMRRFMNKDIARKNNEISRSKMHSNYRKSALEITAQVHTYLDQVVNYGVKEIAYLAKYLQREFEVESNVANTLNNKAKDYEQKIKNYITIALKQEIKRNDTTIIDREFMYLDILSFSNMVLLNEEERMLNMVLENKNYNDTQLEVRKANYLIGKTRVDHKKQIMDFICAKMNICRPFPGFSDHVADLITELLILSDSKLIYLVKYVKEKVKERTNFFKSFIKRDVLEMIALKLTILCQDLSSIRDALTVIKTTITSRHKAVASDDDYIKLRTTAIRILIDVVDTAFSKQRDDLTEITIDTTIKAIRFWQQGDREDIEMPVRLLLDHIVNILREHWNLATRQEVMILTEVMILGESYDEGFDELFTHGSEFVQIGVQPVLV